MNKHRIPQGIINLAGGRSLPDCAGEYSGELLIVGSGRSIWSDLSKFVLDTDVLAVNDMIIHYPRKVKHAYSNHGEKIASWLNAAPEQFKQYRRGCLQHSFRDIRHRGFNYWPLPGRGSSGMGAVLVGLGLGYDSIVLAGMPWDDSGHYFDPPMGHRFLCDRKASNFNNEIADRVIEHMVAHVFEGKVKSLSGRSAAYLGVP